VHRLAALAALLSSLALAGCSQGGGGQCLPDAGEGLVACKPREDGTSADCGPGEGCVPYTATAGSENRCMRLCDSSGACADPYTICSAAAAGLCSRDGGTLADGGVPPQCVTEFVCYPHRC
jgi:hypothetical protein